MDVHLRRLRYFVAVAEELHFTRAAELLHVAQPALSRSVRELEDELRTLLLVRSSRAVVLTPAGQALLPRARALLEAWEAAQGAVADAAAAASAVLRVGFVASAANELTRAILAGFAQRRPGWRVQMSQASWTDPTAGLADRSVDVGLLRLPVPGQLQLACRVLLTEPRWVALPEDHPLAALDEVPFTALLDEPFIATPAGTGVWRDYWLALDERAGRSARIGAEVSSPDEWLQAISNGLGISLTPQASARFYARPGLAYRPVTGIGPSQVAVAWHPDDHRQAVRDFVTASFDAIVMRDVRPTVTRHRLSAC
jgi:DNA-binding transcriptional LysR family regulator